jgi:hypothetical protein
MISAREDENPVNGGGGKQKAFRVTVLPVTAIMSQTRTRDPYVRTAGEFASF